MAECDDCMIRNKQRELEADLKQDMFPFMNLRARNQEILELHETYCKDCRVLTGERVVHLAWIKQIYGEA